MFVLRFSSGGFSPRNIDKPAVVQSEMNPDGSCSMGMNLLDDSCLSGMSHKGGSCLIGVEPLGGQLPNQGCVKEYPEANTYES